MSTAGRGAQARLLDRVQREWSILQDSLHPVTEASYLEAGVVGDWSLRDLLVHIASWEEEALKAIPIILEGKRLPRYRQLYGGIDAFNARAQEEKLHLSLARVRSDMEATHHRLLSRLGKLPDDSLAPGGRLARRVRQDTYAHYHEHTLHVVEWRRQRGL